MAEHLITREQPTHRRWGCCARALQDDQELLTAEAGHTVAAPHDAAQILTEVVKSEVSGLVAKAVIDVFEVVEVEDGEGVLWLE